MLFFVLNYNKRNILLFGTVGGAKQIWRRHLISEWGNCNEQSSPFSDISCTFHIIMHQLRKLFGPFGMKIIFSHSPTCRTEGFTLLGRSYAKGETFIWSYSWPIKRPVKIPTCLQYQEKLSGRELTGLQSTYH